MNKCAFSTPDAGLPDCSTEVTPSSLIPSTSTSMPGIDVLPITGLDSTQIAMIGVILIMVGLWFAIWAPKIVTRWRA